MKIRIKHRTVVTVDPGQIVDVDELQADALQRCKLGEKVEDPLETPKKRYSLPQTSSSADVGEGEKGEEN